VIRLRIVLTFVNRLVKLSPSACAPTASGERDEDDQHGVVGCGGITFITAKRLIRLSMCNSSPRSGSLCAVGAKGGHSRHSADDQINRHRSVQGSVRKTPFLKIFIRLWGGRASFD
jgi:hypothetical protein